MYIMDAFTFYRAEAQGDEVAALPDFAHALVCFQWSAEPDLNDFDTVEAMGRWTDANVPLTPTDEIAFLGLTELPDGTWGVTWATCETGALKSAREALVASWPVPVSDVVQGVRHGRNGVE